MPSNAEEFSPPLLAPEEEKAPNPPVAHDVDGDTSTPAESTERLYELERENLQDFSFQDDEKILPVVGLGGSAGSISALQEFFGRIPTDLGVAYVVVVHLAANYESQLPQILQTRTKMPVVQVRDSVTVEPNCVYVIPPAYHLRMGDGKIYLSTPQQEFGRRVAVDLFFRTLATTHRSRAAAIVLSGVDGDGAIGIKRIKEYGGVTVVQDPDEAEHDGMPRAAIETGMVDWILGIEPMVAKVIEWVRNERRIQLPSAQEPTEAVQESFRREDADETALREVLSFLHTRTGHDFAHYKRATVLRRIGRRLQVNSLEDLPQYVNFLRTHPGEAGALLQDMLISVTNFFRDPESFRALDSYIPRIFRNRNAQETVRVWVPGCATGEEAYSLAMLLAEYAESLEVAPEVQVFATDMDEQALRVAREGIYPATIAADVSPERLRRFFAFDQGRYRVKKEVRERVLFAPHNLLRDSPFSRLDLISCRNLLIYFSKEAQDRVFEVFDFALKPHGLLFLGGSESADDNSAFLVQDKKHRIYERQPVSRSQFIVPSMVIPSLPRMVDIVNPARAIVTVSPVAPIENKPSLSYGDLHLKLLEQSVPPSILINSNYEIVHLAEHAVQFLRFVGGEVSTNILTVIHPSLRLELRTALFRAVRNREDVNVPTITFNLDGEERRVSLRVRPFRDDVRSSQSDISNFVLIIFDEQNRPSESESEVIVQAPSGASNEMVLNLEAELQHLKSYLRTSVEQYESSSEELKASNEELQAMNEEQRSVAEELETSREEIQAANEELITVNQELKSKIEELSLSNADLQNLMASTDIATVFLNRELRIKRYTPRAVDIFSIIPTDSGRPLADLRDRFGGENFVEDAEQVLRSLTPIEREVETTDGHWFLMRATPYRTMEDRIDGVVLAFVDITRRRTAEDSLRESEAKYRTVFDSMGEAFTLCQVVSEGGKTVDVRVLEVNTAYESMSGFSAEQAVGKSLRQLTPDIRDEWIEMCGHIAMTGKSMRFESYAPDLERWFDINGYKVGAQSNGLLAFLYHDITERKRAEEDLRASEAQFRVIFDQAMAGIALMDLTGRFLDVNDQLCALTGYDKEELLRLRMQDITHPDDVPADLEKFERMLEDGIPFEAEKRYIRKNGTVIWIMANVSPVRDASGNFQSVCAIIVDLTERREAERAHRESQEKLRIAVEGADLGTCDWHYTAREMYWNERHFRMFGMEPREVVTFAEFMACVYPEDVSRLREELSVGMEKMGQCEVEFRIVRQNDKVVRWMNDVGRVVARDENGFPTRVGKIMSDVTESREAKEALKRVNDELEWRVEERTTELGTALQQVRAEAREREKAEAARTELLRRLVDLQEEERGRISRELHDNLGQYLTALMLGLKRLQDKNDAFEAEDRQTMSDELNDLHQLVDDLMQAAHRQAWELRPAELDDMGLEIALQHYANDWSQRTGIEVDFQTTGFEERRPAREVETVLYRVVQEALTNVARHANASMVSVVLELTSGASAIIEDDGVGFDPDLVEGRLGLIGMRERLMLVGGTLEIESSPESGTTLFARVPDSVVTESSTELA
ncbi:chemotaxis protein methyltransferase [Abditibacteriota bacterium]|nr:chemotaxis protein methyltransferase [Abditibacteriota bacterium]